MKTQRNSVTLLVIFEVFLGLTLGCSTLREATNSRSSESAPAKISAEDLYKTFQSNEVAAAARYKGKTLTVSGMLGNMGEAMGSTYVLVLPLVVMIGLSKAQTSSPEVIELETGDTTKNIAVAAGVATEGTSKFYLLHNNDAKKRAVRIRLTPARRTGLGVSDQNGNMINENPDSKVFNVFDVVLEKGETIRIEIWPVRVKSSQFTLVITDTTAVATTAAGESRDETIPNPHRHRQGENLLSDVTPEIKFVEAIAPPAAKQENILVNKRGTFSVFTVSMEDGLERIFFTDLASRPRKTYEIQGVGWPNRPLYDPVCAGNFFIFDRSVNPQRSIHYAFDLNKRIIEAARAF